MNITWRLNVIRILLTGYWLLILKVIDLRGENDLISNMMTLGCRTVSPRKPGQDAWRTVTGLGH